MRKRVIILAGKSMQLETERGEIGGVWVTPRIGMGMLLPWKQKESRIESTARFPKVASPTLTERLA
jgi:hypothetical protein